MRTKQRRALLDYADWYRDRRPVTPSVSAGLGIIRGAFGVWAYDKNWAHTAESLAYDGTAVPSTRRAR